MGRAADTLRARWRRMKGRVLAGEGCWAERAAYSLLAGAVSRHKAHFGATDLSDAALWLMFHPEAGVLPCEAWRLSPLPKIPPAEAFMLKARRAAALAAVKSRMGLDDLRLADVAPYALPFSRRVAVHLHVFYPDVLPRILEALCNVPFDYDLFLSVPEGVVVPDLGVPCLVRTCPNRGRDLAPMVCVFGRELAAYDIVGHFHTKKSPHEKGRRDWLGHIIASLLASERTVRRIFALLERGYGMVAAPDYLPTPEDPTGWMRNLADAEGLAARAGLALDLRRDYTPILFPQGSMFWARGDFLRRLLAMPLAFDDFPAEPIGVDGSPAHAMERLLFLFGADTGLRVARVEACP